MKLTRLAAAPGRMRQGAAAWPRRRGGAATASQLIAGVRLTTVVHPRDNGEAVGRSSPGTPRVGNAAASARRPGESLLPRTSAGMRVGGRGHLQASPTTACHSLGWNGKRASAIEQVGGASHAGSSAPPVAGSMRRRTRASSPSARQALLVGFTRQHSGSSRQYRWSRARSRTRR